MKRHLALRTFISLAVALSLALFVAQPVGAQQSQDCSDQPGVTSRVCEKNGLEKFKEFVTSPGRYVAGEAVESFTRWLADGAMWLMGKAIGFIDQSTRPDLGASWFAERYRLMIGLAGLVMAPMLMLAAIRAVIRADFTQLLRSFLLYLPIAILGMFVAVQLTQASLVVTDGLSELVSTNVGNNVVDFYGGVADSLSASGTNPELPLFALFIGSLLIVVGAFFIWLELLVRSAAVYVAMFFLPLTLAVLVWPATARWVRRVIGTLVALVVSKFVIVAVISLATAAMAGGSGGTESTTDGNFSTVLGGGVLLLLAALSPFVLMRFMPVIEEAALSQFESMSRKPAAMTQAGAGNVYQRIFKDRLASEKSTSSTAGVAVAGAGGPGGMAIMHGLKTARSGVQAPVKRMEKQTDLSASPTATANRLPTSPSQSPPTSDAKVPRKES